MKNKKTKKIFHKIFIPIAQILVIFVVFSYAFNYFSTDRFVKNEAREDITKAFDDIKSQLNAFKKSKDSEFTLKASTALIDRGNDTKVYVYDENYNDVAIFDNSVYINSEMTNFISTLLMNYELEENVITTINFNDREYLANTYVASDSLNIEEKYFIVIQDLTEKKAFMKSGLRSMLVVQLVLLLIAVFTVYRVAKDLSNPITNLAKESEKYVVGKGVTINNKHIDIDEVETLRSTLYTMQQNVDKESKRKNTIYENVAHDLRTPLVSILGYADGLKSGIIKDTKKACDIIIKTGNQLKEMIENILMLSRFDNDTYKTAFENIDINDLLIEQIEMIKVIDSDKNLLYESKLQDNKIIYTDRRLLTRIIQNILSNAIKYAKTKVIVSLSAYDHSLAIELNESSHTNDLHEPLRTGELCEPLRTGELCEPRFIISIKDDGDGINDTDINNIFARYYKGEYGHFGIGLAVAKNAISILGGDIKVNTSKGNGTTFSIYL